MSSTLYWLPLAQHGLVAVKLQASEDGTGSFHAYRFTGDATRPGRPLRTLSRAEKFVLDPCQPEHLSEFQEDLSDLPTNDNGLILHHIRKRYEEKGLIYTRVGNDGLVAINPRTRLASHCSPNTLWRVRDQCEQHSRHPEPHVYSLIGKTYNRVMSKGDTQFFTVSGDAGSGKSECIDRAVEYLIYATEKTGARSNIGTTSTGGRGLAHACSIIDPFVHTGSNLHETRACQLKTITFDLNGEIKSWSISVPFLDWDSILRGGYKNAETFNIFHMVLAGSTDEELQELGIDRGRDASQFPYLAGTTAESHTSRDQTTTRTSYLEDYGLFSDAVGALDLGHEIYHVLKLVAAVLHLGRLTFKWSEEFKAVRVDKLQMENVTTIAKLLQISSLSLLHILCKSGSSIGVMCQVERIDVACANAIRDAFAVEVYHRAVRIVLACVNQVGTPQIQTTEETSDMWMAHDFPARSIVLVDPPSVSENTGLSGLYTNMFLEKMRQCRFQRMQSLMRMWDAEGLNLNLSKFWADDNEGCVRTLDNIHEALMGTRDACKQESSGFLRTHVAQAMLNIHAFARQTHFDLKRQRSPKDGENSVAHFDHRVVAYAWPQIIGQLSMSYLIQELASNLFASSKNTRLVEASAAPRAPHAVCSRLTEFLSEARRGVVEVLCLKGNDQGVPMALDTAHVLRQLQLHGASFLTRCAKLRFAHHYSCEMFYQMFYRLQPELPAPHGAQVKAKGDRLEFMTQITKGCTSILAALAMNHVDPEQIRVGKTQVFVRTDKTMQQLSRIAIRLKVHAATKIQAIVRMFLARSRLIHQAMVCCHLDPSVDWQRELILMREEDAHSTRVGEMLAERLWNSEEEVMKRRWEKERSAAIGREVAYLQARQKQRKEERHQHVLAKKRGRTFRRSVIIKLQSHVRGMLCRRRVQCWVDCNELARASRRSAADLEVALTFACKTLLLWRGGTQRLERMVVKARKRVAAAKNVKARKKMAKNSARRDRRPRDPHVRGDTLWM